MRFLSRHFAPTASVLEVGCGLGYFSQVVSRKFRYIGTDIAWFPLHTSRSRNEPADLIQCDAARLTFRQESFDVVFAFDLLEHIPQPRLAISEMYRVLRKNGRLIATTPNIRSLGNRIKAGSKVLTPSMYTDKTHVSLLSPEEWSGLFLDAGFEIARAGADTLWDIPYSTKVPPALQKMVLIPFNWCVSYLFGSLPWTLGENLVFICKK